MSTPAFKSAIRFSCGLHAGQHLLWLGREQAFQHSALSVAAAGVTSEHRSCLARR
jgi:hypothetical protein